MRPTRLAAAAVMALLLLGCTAPAEGPSAVTPPAAPATSATAVPFATPSPSPPASTAPTPSATPAPSREPDAAALRKALVTAADLGRPWVQVESPPDADEACPAGRSAVSRLPFRAVARRDLTRGAGELVNAASFRLAGLAGVDVAEVRAAWAADTRACRQYTDGEGFYVEYRAAEPTKVRGVDEVLLARVERVYFDRGDDEPAYARHTLVARTGPVVATLTHTFLTDQADPEATDFGTTAKLLQTQLQKAETLGE